VRNSIDRFILARLEREGLKPSPEADRARLLRRVSFDLTGLPLTLSELDSFLADHSPNAYEKAVDRVQCLRQDQSSREGFRGPHHCRKVNFAETLQRRRHGSVVFHGGIGNTSGTERGAALPK
jgi:hypothetical protein